MQEHNQVSGNKTTSSTRRYIGRYKQNIRSLRIAKMFVGIICVLLGLVIIGIINSNPAIIYIRNHKSKKLERMQIFCPTAGEGIWCGIWIFLVGIFEILSFKGKGSSIMNRIQNVEKNICNVQSDFQLKLTTAGLVFSGLLLIIAFYYSMVAYFMGKNAVMAFYVILVISAFVSVILLITDLMYYCITNQCCESCLVKSYSKEPIHTYSNQQPIVLQGPVPITIQPGLPLDSYYGYPNFIMNPDNPRLSQVVTYPSAPPISTEPAVLDLSEQKTVSFPQKTS